MTADELWRRFRASGDPAALGAVFDAVSPELFRVALSLAPDAASAEDALQETWLVALKSAASHDAARPVVPWLVGILRRKVHEARRRVRHPDERRVARGVAPVDPSVAAQSREETARLRAAIDELPASCREVAVLRWRYGLEPGEIADARGMPPGTVRSLLHRALARIKRRMKAAPALFLGARWPRGLDDVRAAVLRAAARRSVIDAALASAGGLVMAKATKTAVIAAVACLLLGAGAAVRFSGQSAPARATPPVETTDAATRVASKTRRAGALDAASPAPPVESEKPFARGIVVDEAGAPIAGCRVLVRGHESFSEGESQEAPVRIDATAAAVTGADGRFIVPKKPDDLASLNFLADGFEVAEVRNFDADLRVVLAHVGSFAARVVDTAGRPISGADVRALGPWDRSTGEARCVWIKALTDAAGRFEFLSLPLEARLGPISAWGYRLQGPESYFSPVQEVYVMERTCVLVEVADAATHLPLDDARGVVLGPDGSLAGNVEAQPRIAPSLPHPGRLFWSRTARGDAFVGELRVFAPGHRAKTLPLAVAADAEPPQIVVELEPGDDPPVVAGRVADGTGALVEARFAPQIGGKKTIYGDDLRWPVAAAATVGADGAFSIGGIPRGTYRITVTRAGDPPFSLDVDAPDVSLDLRFPARASLVVRYADTAGRPVANTWICVQTPDARFGCQLRTDADGLAKFDLLPAGGADVIPYLRAPLDLGRAGLDWLAPTPVAHCVLVAGETAHVDLVKPDPVHVSVLVRDDTGRAVAGAEIHADPNGVLLDQEEKKRLKALDLTTDAEGRAAFDVFPCRLGVKALHRGQVGKTTIYAAPGSSPVAEILVPTVVGRVTGRAVERGSGAPVTARPVRVWSNGNLVAEAATDADGSFVAGGIPAGHVLVMVAGGTDANDAMGRRVDPRSPYGSADFEFEMSAGEDRNVAFTMARIRGKDPERPATSIDATVVDGAGSAVAEAWLDVRGLIDGAWCTLGDAQTDATGRAHVDVVAAERYAIRARLSGSGYGVGESPTQVRVEREPAASIVERFVLAPK
jgi:RNA polymerase sigma-70 factor (ECF subfamily)